MDHLKNFPYSIGISFAVCVFTAFLLFKRRNLSKTASRSSVKDEVLGRPSSDPSHSHQRGGEDNKKNYAQDYMEAFALKVARGSSGVINGRQHCSDMSSLLSSGPHSVSRHTASPSTLTMTSPGSEASTTASTTSMSRIAKRLFRSSSSSSSCSSSPSDTFDQSSSTQAQTQERTPAWLMKESGRNPQVLIGCRVFLKGRGQGTITGTQKKKFHSTTFKILFDNNTNTNSNYSDNRLLNLKGEELLKLRRRPDKLGHEFQIIPQHATRR